RDLILQLSKSSIYSTKPSPVSKGWLLTDLAALILSIFFDMNAVVLFRISPENLLCRLFLSLKKQITC
ncbi:hypothetical protein N0S72_24310, partial [Klebsiella pneumoniae]|nr:hypothetical protein [Klebsiella pneumoniae]MCS7343730.1 hypothetical protein [Klebsiella pneumoniae]